MSNRQKQPAKKQQQKKPRQRRRERKDSKSVSAPVAKSMNIRTTKPEMKTRPNGDAIIKHREYITDVLAGVGTPTAFHVLPLAVNPGQSSTFPWLSKVAANYESYMFDSLKFCYETEAPTTLGGTLLMTLDYDASDPAPTSKQQAMAYRSAVRSAPWSACEHISLLEDLRKSKTNFVRPGAQPANTDIKTYDIGNLFLISQGVTTSGASLGELYVEYTVRLMTPIYETVPPLIPGTNITSGGTITAVNPLGDEPVLSVGSYAFSVDNKSDITFDAPGNYLVVVSITGTGITGFSFGGAGPAFNMILADGSEGVWVYQFAIAYPQVITLGATATTVTGTNVYIGSIPTAF